MNAVSYTHLDVYKRQVFTQGRIQQDTLRRCITILKNYARLLAEYGITRPDQIRAVATSFAREAANRDMFVDRVSTATGFFVRILEESEETLLTYLAVRDILAARGLFDTGNVAVMEVGGGQTILLYIRQGKVTVAQSFHAGALRTHELIAVSGSAGNRTKSLLRAYACLLYTSSDERPRLAIATSRAWAQGEVRVGAAQKAARAAHAAAREAKLPAAVAAARSAGHAAATAHCADHSLAAAHYARKAAGAASPPLPGELAWQLAQLPEPVRELIRSKYREMRLLE